jgi:small-conductance mechanosensitive channel
VTEILGFRFNAPPEIVYPVYLLASFTLGWLVARVLGAWLKRLARKTPTRADDIVAEALPGPIGMAIVLAALSTWLRSFPAQSPVHRLAGPALQVAFVAVVTVAIMRLLVLALRSYAEAHEELRPARSLATMVVRIVVVAMGTLMAFDALGISIAPILTTLGVASLAVALALQDTLSNFFGGLYLLADRPVRPGDFVRLESGAEGYVDSIGWRSTRIRQLSNNIVVVPNARLAQSIVTNFHLPDPGLSALVPVGASYGADPERVLAVLEEVAKKAAGEVPGMLADPAPFARFTAFGESAMEFTVIVRVREFADQFLAAHELRRRVFARFKQEGIEIPFPQRVVHVAGKQEIAR